MGSVFESMPQVILQTAFIIRSYNDERLREDGNSLLLLASLIGSVISVADKFIWNDESFLINPTHKGWQFKKECRHFIDWWYLVAVFWRYCQIIARFAVFSLVWGVCGGWWLGIYLVFSYFVTLGMIGYGYVDPFKKKLWKVFFTSLTTQPGLLLHKHANPKMIIFRWVDNVIGFLLISAFGFFKFQCSICANEDYRQFGTNPVIDGIFIIGCVSWVADIILFIILYRNGVFVYTDEWRLLFRSTDRFEEETQSEDGNDLTSIGEKTGLTSVNNAV